MSISLLKRVAGNVLPVVRLMAIVLGISAAILLLDTIAQKQEGSTRKRLALIQYNDSPLSEMSLKGIYDGLTAIGYEKGRDYELEVANAQGDIATLNLMVDAITNNKPDLLFVTSTPTLQAVSKKIKNIPVVFSVVADPVLAGAGTSFADHLPNITGISTLSDFVALVKWVKIILPSAKKIGTIYSPGEVNSVKNMNDLKRECEKNGLTLITVPVNTSLEVTDAILALTAQRPEVICQIVDNLTSSSAPAILKISKTQHIPLFGFVSDQAEKGAVLVVSRDYHQAGVDAVKLAKKIFDGEEPAKIPFEFVSKTNIIVNPGAAASYQIKLPEELYKQKNLIIKK